MVELRKGKDKNVKLVSVCEAGAPSESAAQWPHFSPKQNPEDMP